MDDAEHELFIDDVKVETHSDIQPLIVRLTTRTNEMGLKIILNYYRDN